MGLPAARPTPLPVENSSTPFMATLVGDAKEKWRDSLSPPPPEAECPRLACISLRMCRCKSASDLREISGGRWRRLSDGASGFPEEFPPFSVLLRFGFSEFVAKSLFSFPGRIEKQERG